MSSPMTIILLWTAAISSGLMAGVYFAFYALFIHATIFWLVDSFSATNYSRFYSMN